MLDFNEIYLNINVQKFTHAIRKKNTFEIKRQHKMKELQFIRINTLFI